MTITPAENPFPNMQEDETGAILPPLDEKWPELVKLRWYGATLRVRHGIDVTVTDGALTVGGRRKWGWYGITARRGAGSSISLSAYRFRDAWALLIGIGTGARIGGAE